MTINYRTRGTCSRAIDLTIENGIITHVAFTGGCNGNLKGISRLVTGRDAKEVAETLRGVDCGGKGTSCSDQLSKAIEQALAQEA